MKRILFGAAALALGLTLAGCSSETDNSACVGEWTLSGMEQDGESTSAEEIAQLQELGLDMGITVEEGGAANLDFVGEQQSGTWEPSADGCTFTLGGEPVVATVQDDKLVMEEDGQKIIFERK